VVYGNKLYSLGGRSGPSDFGDVEIYDASSDRWTPGPPIEPRGTAGAAVYCGTIYIFGGESQARGTTLSEVLTLDNVANVWRHVSPMPEARNYARAVVFRGAVYLVGGNFRVADAHGAPGSTLVERFQPC
jgi:N-acetylneuraminic acid mutarotase